MSVNFYKNRDSMVNAWKDVMNDNSSTNWALFGYEKQANDLTLVDKGVGGLDELFEQFNNSKILYAFCRVFDENTELTKYLFINWQGEGAPLSRKGVCVNHFRDVNDFFKGAHLTINARTEEDVEPQTILSLVSKVSAKVNLKDRLDITENMAPVGTNYKRVQPQREISQTDREKFWEKTQEEEKRRLVEEKKRAQEMKLKLDKEREDRELSETKQRDVAIKERELKVRKMREIEQNAANAAKNENNEASKLNSIDDDERRRRSEAMRRERAEEAKSVISQNSIKSARALFERNTSAGQLSTIKYTQSNITSNKIDSKLVPNSSISSNEVIIENTSKAFESINLDDNTIRIDRNSNVNNSRFENDDQILTHIQNEHKVEEPLQTDYTRNMLQDQYIDSQPLEDIAEEQIYEDTAEYNNAADYPIRQAANEPNNEDNVKMGDGLRARALFDYQAADETEISFDPEDIITHIEQIDEGWWQGMASDGTYGLFPANYVELIE